MEKVTLVYNPRLRVFPMENLPQVRWEFVPNWVLEAGVLIQVIGSGVIRKIIGLAYKF